MPKPAYRSHRGRALAHPFRMNRNDHNCRKTLFRGRKGVERRFPPLHTQITFFERDGDTVMKETILVALVVILLLTFCFPAGASVAMAEEAAEVELPASFDLRSVDTDGDGIGDRCYVTPVRFQNPFSSCWAFAAVSTAETSLLGSVYADDPDAWKTLNLSERQLAYFSHMPLNDPSNTHNGEGFVPSDPRNMSQVFGSGSTIMAVSLFAQGVGPSDEHPAAANVGESFEYHGKERVTTLDYIDGAFRNYFYSDEDDWSIPEEFRFHQNYLLVDAHFLPAPAVLDAPEHYTYNEAGTTAIKRELLQKRGVMVSVRADANVPETLTGANVKYISENWAHYTWDFGASNHSVAIVGWDDHYPKENFLSGHQPPADGAWLVKNSWGSALEEFPSYGRGNWGIVDSEGRHTGYFWISYYDHSISEPVSMELKVAPMTQSVDQFDYCPAAALYTETRDTPVAMANVFRADHSKTLRAISCMTGSAGTSVRYRIYLLQDAYQSPEDGLMVAEDDVFFPDAGFHRIPVGEIRVQRDQYYSVSVALTNADGKYDIITPKAGTIFDDGDYVAIVNEKESYLLQDGQWQDYKTIVDAQLNESKESGSDELIHLGYDNFPIKTYGDRASADVKLKLTHSNTSLSMMEGYDSDICTLQLVASSGFGVGHHPSIEWRLLPGSEGIVEIEPKEQNSRLILTAKAPGTALLSVSVEGIGTKIFPVEVRQGRLDFALVVESVQTYTGQEIKPLVLVLSDIGATPKQGVHYELKYTDNIRCGLARAEVTGIGTCEVPGAEPLVDYFTIVPGTPDILSLSARDGEIHLSVTDLSDTGADGCQVQYRLKGSEEWKASSFGAGQTDLIVGGLASGEYEVQVCAFVDNTDDSVPEEHRKIACGAYGETRTVVVP